MRKKVVKKNVLKNSIKKTVAKQIEKDNTRAKWVAFGVLALLAMLLGVTKYANDHKEVTKTEVVSPVAAWPHTVTPTKEDASEADRLNKEWLQQHFE